MPTLALPLPHRARTNLLGHLHHLITLRKQRRALLLLDARLLDDIGLTRSQALSEAARPLWDAPRHWHGNTL